MKEAELYAPVREWLTAQGLTVYPEVPVGHRTADAVGVGAAIVIGIELKRSLTEKVLHQASTLQLSCDKVYVAVGTRPRNPERATKIGLGVLSVIGAEVTVIQEPGEHEHVFQPYRAKLLELCARLPTGGVGGVPCLDGVGPAQDCKRRVEEYRKNYPKATWKELFQEVPNHYASAKSMAQSLTAGIALRARLKKLRKKWKAENKR